MFFAKLLINHIDICVVFPNIRFFVRLKGYVRNRAHPEGSIAEGYIADECLTFCSRFIRGLNKSSSTSVNTNLEEENYLFDSLGDAIGSVQDVKFDGKTLIQAHRYVLRHIDELEDFCRYANLVQK